MIDPPARSRRPTDADLAVALAGFLFLVVSTIALLDGRGLLGRVDGPEPLQPKLWPVAALLYGLQLLASVAALGINRGCRWGWVGTGTALGLWATVAALLGRPVTTVVAIGFALYILARANEPVEPSRG